MNCIIRPNLLTVNIGGKQKMLKILIVEDQPAFKVEDALDYLKFKNLKCEIKMFSSAVSSMRYIRDNLSEIDLAIIDLGIPYFENEPIRSKTQGFEVIQEIERNAAKDDKKKSADISIDSTGQGDDGDEMIPKAIEVVIEQGMASTTLLQRKLKLGYARAARIIDELSEKGIVGPYEGSKPRKVLITKQQWYEMNALAQGGADKPYGEDEEDTSEE